MKGDRREEQEQPFTMRKESQRWTERNGSRGCVGLNSQRRRVSEIRPSTSRTAVVADCTVCDVLSVGDH